MKSEFESRHPQPTAEEVFHKYYRNQKEYFNSGATYSYEFRKARLQQLKKLIKENESEILQALAADLGKPGFEAYASEVGFVYEEINLTLKKLVKWMKRRKVSTPLSSWPSESYVLSVPKGVTLVIAPWNYPFQLAITPMIAAMAAGNTVILKAPEQTYHTALLMERMISENFESRYLAVVQGHGEEVVPKLLNNHRFDHVFFTGSTGVGKKIAQMAAPHLTPVTLELGGKSPCIVDASADLEVAARRIAFGKWLNAGQTCVAPDYLLVHSSVYNKFVGLLKKTVVEFYGEKPLQSENLARMINRPHFDRLKDLPGGCRIEIGGSSDENTLKIEPTIVLDPSLDSDLMQEEIFGPILPVISWTDPAELPKVIAQNPNPLSFYFFGKNAKLEKDLIQNVQFGGGAVNNAIVHLSNPNLPFGGVAGSGFGNYHGKAGFDTFSHQKSIMKTANWFDLKLKYPPYTDFSNKVIRWIMR